MTTIISDPGDEQEGQSITNKKYRLPKQFAEQWLKDLRSGEYGQCKNSLKTINRNQYCCLGLAVISSGYSLDENNTELNEAIQKGWISDSSWVTSEYNENLFPNYPIELVNNNEENDFATLLAEMNDEGQTFLEIADFIEQNCEFYE